MHREVLRASGTREPLPHPITITKAAELIGADTLTTVNLRDGRIMLVDDTGHHKGLPINAEATSLYHSICRPGTTWKIVGDAVIVFDADYAEDDEP